MYRGETMTIQETAMKQLETEVKLCINKQLYEEGLITEDMYIKAKNIILSK